MTEYALVDCNNFFVSCERVFRPELENRPVIVLSSNDGCAIARSNEAKALGIKMGQPFFQIKGLAERCGVRVLSANFHLYADMSNRVMQALADAAPMAEPYSIDECFLDLTGIADRGEFGRMIRHRVKQWTGIPVGVGIAETKTLAKIANRIAKTSKKTGGVLDLAGSRWRGRALAMTEVGDVWGVGRRFNRKLLRNGVETALDLSRLPDMWVRKEMGVIGLKTVRELRGEDCIGFEDAPRPKKTTMVSRSFGREITELDDLAGAVATFASMVSEELRRRRLVGSVVSVFLSTNRFSKGPRHHPSLAVELAPPTASARKITAAALKALREIYRDGFGYKKAGVMVLDLVDADHAPRTLFDRPDPREDRLMEAFDRINRRLGSGAIRVGPAAARPKWLPSSAHRSPRYTTDWADVPAVRA